MNQIKSAQQKRRTDGDLVASKRLFVYTYVYKVKVVAVLLWCFLHPLSLSYADVQILMSSGLETEFTANGSFQDDEHTLNQSQTDSQSHSGSVNGLAESVGTQGPYSPLLSPGSPAAELEALGSLGSEQPNGNTGPGEGCTSEMSGFKGFCLLSHTVHRP